MALTKKVYVDNQTVIPAANLNAIQDEVIANATAIGGKAPVQHTHTKSQITDFPTSLPASDVSAWAKASTKPTYTASEVGAAPTSHTHTKSQITDLNTYLFHEGKNYTSYAFMGSHQVTEKRKKGIRFTTWAPNAINVYVSGDFCNFAIEDKYKMEKITEKGIWSIFIEGVEPGIKYKYVVEDRTGNKVFKADPYAVTSEVRPATASITCGKTQYKWND